MAQVPDGFHYENVMGSHVNVNVTLMWVTKLLYIQTDHVEHCLIACSNALVL